MNVEKRISRDVGSKLKDFVKPRREGFLNLVVSTAVLLLNSALVENEVRISQSRRIRRSKISSAYHVNAHRYFRGWIGHITSSRDSLRVQKLIFGLRGVRLVGFPPRHFLIVNAIDAPLLRRLVEDFLERATRRQFIVEKVFGDETRIFSQRETANGALDESSQLLFRRIIRESLGVVDGNGHKVERRQFVFE